MLNIMDFLKELGIIVGISVVVFSILGLVLFLVSNPPNWWKKVKTKTKAYLASHWRVAEVIDYILYCIKGFIILLIIAFIINMCAERIVYGP